MCDMHRVKRANLYRIVGDGILEPLFALFRSRRTRRQERSSKCLVEEGSEIARDVCTSLFPATAILLKVALDDRGN